MGKERVLIGLSGGVDSSVAAALLVEQGYEVIAVTLKLYDHAELDFDPPDGGCCSIDMIDDARSVCSRLNIPHYVLDLRDSFRKNVIGDFLESYSRGRTPNPCINCNTHIKWGEMLKTADKLGCQFIATGHYARIDRSCQAPRLLKGLDRSRDQSYALWGIPRDSLKRTLLPLGELAKRETREIAEINDFRNADRPDSQEICFVPTSDYANIIRQRLGNNDPSLKPGPIYDSDGRTIGEHKGYANYTIGQRRGLGISFPEPLYVTGINPGDRSITVGIKERLFGRWFTIAGVNLLVSGEEIPGKIDVKIRYRHDARAATLKLTGDKGEIIFVEPQRAITPGQSAVFYDDDLVIGGGIIDEVLS
jgi:tRNA-specific 2-thiouridylase